MKIRKRIEEISRFIDYNHQDIRISAFDKIRTKLKNLLNYDLKVLIDNNQEE